jgi:hypothetical protein
MQSNFFLRKLPDFSMQLSLKPFTVKRFTSHPEPDEGHLFLRSPFGGQGAL